MFITYNPQAFLSVLKRPVRRCRRHAFLATESFRASKETSDCFSDAGASMKFELIPPTAAPAAVAWFERGVVETPALCPLAPTAPSRMTPEEVEATGAQIFRQHLPPVAAPGSEIMKLHGDLHDFMQWKGPIRDRLRRFQVFSLISVRSPSRRPLPQSDQRRPIFSDPENRWRSVRSRL